MELLLGLQSKDEMIQFCLSFDRTSLGCHGPGSDSQKSVDRLLLYFSSMLVEAVVEPTSSHLELEALVRNFIVDIFIQRCARSLCGTE
jgi:hypothetical protein